MKHKLIDNSNITFFKKGIKICLFPNKEQEKTLSIIRSRLKEVYNWYLSSRIDLYENSNINYSAYTAISDLVILKNSTKEFKWVKDLPADAVKHSIMDCESAFKKFFKRNNKGFPKFKNRKSDFKIYQSSEKTSLKFINNKLYISLTGIGNVEVHLKQIIKLAPKYLSKEEKLEYMRHFLNKKNTKFFNFKISTDSKFWYISFMIEFKIKDEVKEGILGIDLGINKTAVSTLLTKDKITLVHSNINKERKMKKLIKRKKKLQRQLSKHYLTKRPKTKNVIKKEIKLRLLDRKISNIRLNYNYLVVKDLFRLKPKVIVLEDLNISGMMKNKYLSKAIQEQNLYRIKEIITYKASWTRTNILIANRYYPSSKTCNKCKVVNKRLKLNQREFKCNNCGLEMDRDENASINLASLV